MDDKCQCESLKCRSCMRTYTRTEITKQLEQDKTFLQGRLLTLRAEIQKEPEFNPGVQLNLDLERQ